MKPQEVISVIVNIEKVEKDNESRQVISYPELDTYFDRGLYIESLNQIRIGGDKYLLTAVFRQYSSAQSK